MSKFFSKHDFLRKHFGKFTAKTSIPTLSGFYRKSYEEFLQLEKQPHERDNSGLESLLRSLFPLECRKLSPSRESLANSHQREVYFYSHYEIHFPEQSEEDCRVKGTSYFGSIHIATFKVDLKNDLPLTHPSNQHVTQKRNTEQDFVGFLNKHTFILPLRGIPFMTQQGTFLINGIERALLAQLQRCPGTYLTKRKDFVHLKVIPYYGSNLQWEIGKSGKIFLRMMGKRRIPLSLFLHGLGIPAQEILSLFFNPLRLRKNASDEVFRRSSQEDMPTRISYDMKRFLHGFTTQPIYDAVTGQIRIPAGTEMDSKRFQEILSSTIRNPVLQKEQWNHLSYCDTPSSTIAQEGFSTKKTQTHSHFLTLTGFRNDRRAQGEKQVYVHVHGTELSKPVFYHPQNLILWKKRLLESFHEFEIQETLTSFSKMIHLMRGNTSAHPICSEKEREELLKKMLLDPIHFNLSNFGRIQTNETLQIPKICHHGSLTRVDLYSLTSYLIRTLYHSQEQEENLYQLQNRKVRLPGELFGYLLLKSFLQIKRKKEFSYRFQPPATEMISTQNTQKNTLPEFVRSRMIDSFLLRLYEFPEDPRNPMRAKWILYRSFLFSDSTDKLTQAVLPSVKRQIDSFLTGSNLSQLLDQLNPLSEMTHLRRLSLLGPDGLNKDNVSLDTRDVQSSFFGRICPIETPEGKAVGIVNSMTISSMVDEQGDLLTPYLCVKNGRLQTEVHYLSSKKECEHAIALLEESVNDSMEFRQKLVYCRYQQQFVYLEKERIEYIDVSPKQMLSVSSSLIPFLSHNDGNRALMGSNMQRQAVPSLVKELAFVGTGAEDTIANQTNSLHERVLCWQDNLSFFYTDVLQQNRFPIETHSFSKFEKANQKSYKNDTSRRSAIGETFVDPIQMIDSTGTKQGQLAIGHNLLVGFMSMNGYSFEDSIVISDRILKDSLFSSLHTKEFIVFDWDTNQSNPTMTRHIPNVPPKDVQYLDEDGIIKVGSPLSGGDILIGKVVVRSRAKKQVSEKEKFLQGLLLGEPKEFVKDASERTPLDIEGYVLDVKKYFSVAGEEISDRSLRKKIQATYQAYLLRTILLQHHFLQVFLTKLFESLEIQIQIPAFLGFESPEANAWMTEKKQWKKVRGTLHALSHGSSMSWASTFLNRLRTLPGDHREVHRELKKILMCYVRKSQELRITWYRKHLSYVSRWIQCTPSTMPLRMVKVIVAYKHKLKPGDKMTGRHGNKGVISQVVPMQDMPYTLDGMPMDIILNPIGISSRMNLGQVFEVHFGLASTGLGQKIKKLLRIANPDHRYFDMKAFLYHIYGDTKEQRILSKLSEKQMRTLLERVLRGVPIATSPFSGASDQDVKDYLEMANLNPHGQVDLYDGKTGEKFDRQVTSGYMYMLKLNHLVDDKIHSRFTGPYNRVTEQPLGGKSLHGGQRFGEMEVWALQAYGAAYTLLDMTTVKSDSRLSRMESAKMKTKSHRAKKTFPEAFNVLLRELWCLGLLLKVS